MRITKQSYNNSFKSLLLQTGKIIFLAIIPLILLDSCSNNEDESDKVETKLELKRKTGEENTTAKAGHDLSLTDIFEILVIPTSISKEVNWSIVGEDQSGVSISGEVLEIATTASPTEILIKATLKADESKSATASLNVTATTVSVTGITIQGEMYVAAGSDVKLSAEVLPSDATNSNILWTIEPSVEGVSVSDTGLVSVGANVSGGTNIIVKATANDGSGIIGTKEIMVTVQFELNPANWINQLLTNYPKKDISLNDLSIPMSHNTGTYELNNCTFGANACNVQNQEKTMAVQMELGARMFDIRPILEDDKYLTRHSTSCFDSGDAYGCRGAEIKHILEMTRGFLASHNELIIFEFSHWCSTGYTDETFLSLVSSTLGDNLYKESADQSTSFINRPLKNIIPPDGNSGKVIIIYEGAPNTLQNRSKGIFSNDYLRREGSYANAQNFENMLSDQTGKLKSFSDDSSSLFELSWLITLDANQSIQCALGGNESIKSFALDINQKMGSTFDQWISDGTLTSEHFPHIVNVDFVDRNILDQCYKITKLSLGIE